MAYTYKGHGFDWSAERVKVLTTMWKDGKSAGQIAEHFGNSLSRNAVIGKLHRLGLKDHCRSGKRTRKSYVTDKIRRQIYGHMARKAQGTSQAGFRSFLKDATEPLPEPQIGDVARVKLLDLESHHCRYPVADGFCGDHKVSGLPYCETHVRRCYRGTVSSPNEFRLADFKARPKVPA